MQEWAGEKMVVDKSPYYALHPAVLRRAEDYFESPFYIHLLRHPASTIESFVEARIDQAFWYAHPFSVSELAELVWVISHQNILEFLNRVPRHRQHRVRFEDLVVQPKRVMEEACGFLGLEFHPDMLQPYKDTKTRMTDGLHGVPRMLGDLKFHTHTDIDPSVAERWKKNGSGTVLADVTWEIANQIGYRID